MLKSAKGLGRLKLPLWGHPGSRRKGAKVGWRFARYLN